MFTDKDLITIKAQHLTESVIYSQIELLKKGFPFLEVVAPATLNNGVVKLNANQSTECMYAWEDYLLEGGSVEKFVPASGAASRMFKKLYEFLSFRKSVPTTDFENKFFNNIKNFAFYNDLNEICENKLGLNIDGLISDSLYSDIVRLLLTPEGLNYGSLPKGILKFHKTDDSEHTAIEEHLEEGAQTIKDKNGTVKIHFTISPEHKRIFEDLIMLEKIKLEDKYNLKYDISLSEQKSSTNTIAVNLDNSPFRDANGSLLFRPGGHGSLIENLNEREANVIFIKNIDNVVPKSKRDITIKYKKIIGGYLIILQKEINKYLTLLESGHYTIEDLREIIHFIHDKLNIRHDNIKNLDDSELAIFLKEKLNRPIRVCGVVLNDGEPGGGPFIVYNQDGSTSLQILESTQFNEKDTESMKILNSATYFNPVDLVCYVKDIKGNKFDLRKYVDANTGFISYKSKDGKELKALERPGLWNGAMSDWNTVFVEVPIETFNPVKTVNDLLRHMHQ